MRIDRAAPPDAPRSAVFRLFGTIIDTDESALTLKVAGPEQALVRVPRREITRIEVYTGQRNRATSAVIGTFIGAASLGAAFVISNHGAHSAFWDFPDSTAATAGILVGAPLGALIGAAVGGGERWQEVPSESVRVGVRLTPQERGVVASLSITF